MAIWINDYVQKNKYSRPAMKLEKVKGIILHYTANPGGTAKNHADFFDGSDGGGSRYAGCHLFADKKEVRLIVPLSEVCYHANDRKNKISKLGSNANFTTVGIEMCIEKDGSIHPDTYKNTLKTVIELCKTYKLDENDLYRHYDVTGKSCPLPWVEKPSEFTRFKSDVKKGLTPAKKAETKPKESSFTYRVRKSKDDVKTQKGAFTKLDNAKDMADKNKGYKVFDENGKLIYTPKDNSPKPKEDSAEGTVKVLAESLYYYNRPDWKFRAGTVKKDDVFTVVDTLTVDGGKMHKLKSGNYLTANTKHVKFTKK